MKTATGFMLFATLLLMLAPAVFGATTGIDSLFSTQAGDWRYGYYSSGSTFVQMNTYTPGAQEWWTTTDNGISSSGAPVLGRSAASTVGEIMGTLGPGEVYFHPGPSVETVLRYIIPIAGDYTVNATFTSLDGGDKTYRITDGAVTPVYTSPSLSGTGSATTGSFLLTGLSAGATIDIVVNNNGWFGYDSGKVAATIDYVQTGVPEPSTLLLLLAGAAGLCTLRRR